MKSRLLVVAVVACSSTDQPAIDASAASDIGSETPVACAPCSYALPSAAGTVAVPGASELSGLVVGRALSGAVWTHNDSGDTARVFAMGHDGSHRGTLTLSASATDWEDIAAGPCGDSSCLYVADIGDNAEARASVRIHEIDEPATISPAGAAATFRQLDVSYPDGPHNAESLVVDPRDGDLYIITKQSVNPSTVFRVPGGATGTAVAIEVGRISTPSGSALVTGADLYADECGVRMLVRTTTSLFELRAAPSATVAELVAFPLVVVPVASEAQGEAVAYLLDGRGYLTVSEGAAPPLNRVMCQ